MLTLLLELFFPKRCLNCHKLGTYLCPSCQSQIKQTNLVCPYCERLAIGGQTHPLCQRKYGLNGLWSLGLYSPPLKPLIKKLKYGFIKELANLLVDLLITYWVKYQPFLLDEIKKDRGENWIIAPVPLHWQRQNSRGFNQSALLAQILAQKLGIKYQPLLIKTKSTKPQAQLKGQDRFQNLKGAFQIIKPIPNLSVIIIDDVWTTGSTIKECCYILKKNGAQKVWAITLAR